jgi:hypothetical protein
VLGFGCSEVGSWRLLGFGSLDVQKNEDQDKFLQK